MKTVTKDEYQAWLDNDVTKRFLEEMQVNLDEATAEQIYGTHEEMIRAAHERNAAMDVLQNMIEWKPKELETDEND